MPKQISDHVPLMALDEYTGIFPGMVSHGNLSGECNAFIHTQGQVIDEIVADMKGSKPRAIFKCLDSREGEQYYQCP